MRVKTNLSRVNAFKFACEKSVWYYSLIKRLIKEDIHEKPLVKFVTGKFWFLIVYMNCSLNKKCY